MAKGIVRSDGNGGLIIKKVAVFVTSSITLISILINIILLVLINPIKAEVKRNYAEQIDCMRELQTQVSKLKDENIEYKVAFAEIHTELIHIKDTLNKIERKLP